MYIVKYGEYVGTDAVIMFIEDAIQPYHPRGMNYDQDATLEDLDARRLTYKTKIRGAVFSKLGSGISGAWPLIVIGIFGIAVLMAFVGGGGI